MATQEEHDKKTSTMNIRASSSTTRNTNHDATSATSQVAGAFGRTNFCRFESGIDQALGHRLLQNKL